MRFLKLRRLTLVATLALGCLAGGTTSALAQRGEVIIRTAPPAPRYEARGSLRAGYEWVPGYWRWERGRHVWVRGHWERQRRGWSWQQARWDRRHDGWVFIPGRWARAGRYDPGPSDRPPYDDRRGDGPDYDRPGDGRHGGRDGGRDGRPGWGRRHWERQGWALLGEQWVSGRQDHDFVPIGRRQGRFTRVLLVAEQGDFQLHDIVIEFSNGRAWSPRLDHYFREGQRSRTLVLPNAPRGLRSVKLHYGNLPGGGRALVQVWAR